MTLYARAPQHQGPTSHAVLSSKYAAGAEKLAEVLVDPATTDAEVLEAATLFDLATRMALVHAAAAQAGAASGRR